MILKDNQLAHYRKKVVMVDGCFDPLHIGHLKYFEEAERFNFPILCNVQSDEYILSHKRRPVVLPQEQRIKLIDSLKPISYVYLCKTSTAQVLDILQPLKYIKGIDWKERGLPPEEVEICKKNNIEIVYLNTNIDTSTQRMKDFLKRLLTFEEEKVVEEFERYVLNQKEIKPDYYDEDYFMGEWRKGEVYSLERRRKKEAKNPENIKKVFNPKCVLDVGCGPGALMYFLYELGIKEVYGIDFSPYVKELAHPSIKSNIIIVPVTEFYEFDKKFDLVICRELLEHLTVLQIRKVVRNLAKWTSKYIYVTTRFHNSPQSLVDVTDDKETDPTHITLLNKNFLRVFFVLEGLQSRPDLEKKLDWKGLGRVLVFEKIDEV